jgi:hypothetical protein
LYVLPQAWCTPIGLLAVYRRPVRNDHISLPCSSPAHVERVRLCPVPEHALLQLRQVDVLADLLEYVTFGCTLRAVQPRARGCCAPAVQDCRTGCNNRIAYVRFMFDGEGGRRRRGTAGVTLTALRTLDAPAARRPRAMPCVLCGEWFVMKFNVLAADGKFIMSCPNANC